MSCPRCSVGIIEGGTGCVICNFCHSVFKYDIVYGDTDSIVIGNLKYMYSFEPKNKKKEKRLMKVFFNGIQLS